MCKINEIINYKGQNYKRISKTALKSMFTSNLFTKDKKDINVYAIPCKANIFSMWIEFFKGTFQDITDINKWLNEVSYYNCNNEMGNYLHYYVEV